ncbi:MAG: hypothetical protein ACYTHN_21665 [Planctomycetota bacterium]|jgi:hypothetical protein
MRFEEVKVALHTVDERNTPWNASICIAQGGWEMGDKGKKDKGKKEVQKKAKLTLKEKRKAKKNKKKKKKE